MQTQSVRTLLYHVDKQRNQLMVHALINLQRIIRVRSQQLAFYRRRPSLQTALRSRAKMETDLDTSVKTLIGNLDQLFLLVMGCIIFCKYLRCHYIQTSVKRQLQISSSVQVANLRGSCFIGKDSELNRIGVFQLCTFTSLRFFRCRGKTLKLLCI